MTRIVVLGMHRSGTSLLAEMVHAWGASAGEPSELMQADEINARGYWEHWPLVRFDDELLAEVGARWLSPPADSDRLADLALAPAWRQRAQELIGSMDDTAPVWVWKDPRLAVLLAFWNRVWDRPIHVIAVREPMESACSLARRDDVPLTAGLLLWQVSMLRILEHAVDGERRLFVDYGTLLRDPAAEARRLGEFLGRHAGGRRLDDETLRGMTAVVDPSLHRERSERTFDEEPSAEPAQKALHEHLLSLVRDPGGGFRPDAFPLYPGWRDYLDTVGRLWDLRREATSTGADERLAERERELSHRERRIEEREQLLASMIGLHRFEL